MLLALIEVRRREAGRVGRDCLAFIGVKGPYSPILYGTKPQTLTYNILNLIGDGEDKSQNIFSNEFIMDFKKFLFVQ